MYFFTCATSHFISFCYYHLLVFQLVFWIQILIILIHSTKQLEEIFCFQVYFSTMISSCQFYMLCSFLFTFFTIDICMRYNVISFILLWLDCSPDITFQKYVWISLFPLYLRQVSLSILVLVWELAFYVLSPSLKSEEMLGLRCG